MNKTLLASAAIVLALGSAVHADEMKIGVILSFTGPIESLTPDMAAAAELAMAEVTASGALLGGSTITPVRGDATCIDAAAAQTAAERLIDADGVKAIVGADCSGVTTAILQNVAKAKGVLMVSPSATSPALSTIEDDGLFFRTAPSDARQGQVVADILASKGIGEIAITYTNNDYGKGLSESIAASHQAMGGTVTINIPIIEEM